MTLARARLSAPHVVTALVLLLASSACASSPGARAPLANASAAGPRWRYHAAVQHVPADAREVELCVGLPGDGVRAPSVYGLVGNAPFELTLPDTPSGTIEAAHVRVCWGTGASPGARELSFQTAGKPLEIAVRLEGVRGSSREALEAELAHATRATVDARPAEALVTRLERPAQVK